MDKKMAATSRIYRKIFIILFALIINSAYAGKNSIDKIINKTDSNLNIGIKVVNLHQGKTAYERNANRYYIPASSLKFITIMVALKDLGLDYLFEDNLYKKNNNYYIEINSP